MVDPVCLHGRAQSSRARRMPRRHSDSRLCPANKK
jgi:hypothetical protein